MRYVNLSTILVYRLVSKKVISIYLGRDTELNENEFLPVSNLTLCLLSASPDTFVRQGMRWNFNDQLPRHLFISPTSFLALFQVSDRFPDLDSLVAAKLLLPHEAERLQRVDFRFYC